VANFIVPYGSKVKTFDHTGVQSKNNVYHIVDKVQNSYENTLKFDLIDNVVYVVFALYSSINFLFLKFTENIEQE
jgi:hypothetical protein